MFLLFSRFFIVVRTNLTDSPYAVVRYAIMCCAMLYAMTFCAVLYYVMIYYSCYEEISYASILTILKTQRCTERLFKR